MATSNCAMCKHPLMMWGGPVSLDCGHEFCLDCLQQKYSVGASGCPLCRNSPEPRKAKQFYYDCPHPEETGEWIPISVPPTDVEDYAGIFGDDMNYFPAESEEWVRSENLLGAVKGAVKGVLSKGKGKMQSEKSFYIPADMIEDVKVMKTVFEAEPPVWLPDSSATSCMQCGANFRAMACLRHHCRFCGRIFCGDCSSSRRLLPSKFRIRDPQRVCDTCSQVLKPGQRLLAMQVCNAYQFAPHDITDKSCLRAWLNSPWGFSMEQEIYKATNTLRSYCKVDDHSLRYAMLGGAKGLAILTVIKGGMMLTYKFGSGLVIARRDDGTWSPPSAIASCGLGWGPQVGGEITDLIIVLRTEEAVKAFSGRVHVSVGGGLSMAAGPLGRLAEADIRSCDGSSIATCYTYSLSKGVFVGCSLECSVVVTRNATNGKFYGDYCMTSGEILFGSSLPHSTAAAPLYKALSSATL